MTVVNEEPPRPTWRSRLAFLKTKRAIAALTLLVVVAVILIALGATHVIGPHGGGGGDKNGDEVSPVTPTGDGPWKPDNSSTVAEGTPLRIMCLGGSIVRGELSDDLNGFRDTMRADLVAYNATVNMVGSQRFGNMLDNDEEAYGGKKIAQVYEYATKVVPLFQPNLFVINVGTNNVLQREDVNVSGSQMETFIDYLLEASPRSTVVLSTLLTNTVPEREPLVLEVNQQFRDVFSKYENQSVVLAELHPGQGSDDVPQVADIGPDGSHPTAHGYELMGHILADAIKGADEKGYLRWPVENGLAHDGNAGRAGQTGAATATEEVPPKTTHVSTKTTSATRTTSTSSAA
ncbi:SGNH hydrolase-type esterase domain-containing protein [Xylariaceae sp. FL1019]|nr:SGNH hydrolase-type esterase domain-containing protein [Xylariaceae sp. FL1019]